MRRAGFPLWLLSAFTGTILLIFTSFYSVCLIFGVDRRDSSAVWGLAGLAPILLAFMCYPVFLLTQAISFVALRERATPAATTLYSMLVGVILTTITTVIVYASMGGGKVLRSG